MNISYYNYCLLSNRIREWPTIVSVDYGMVFHNKMRNILDLRSKKNDAEEHSDENKPRVELSLTHKFDLCCLRNVLKFEN